MQLCAMNNQISQNLKFHWTLLALEPSLGISAVLLHVASQTSCLPKDLPTVNALVLHQSLLNFLIDALRNHLRSHHLLGRILGLPLGCRLFAWWYRRRDFGALVLLQIPRGREPLVAGFALVEPVAGVAGQMDAHLLDRPHRQRANVALKNVQLLLRWRFGVAGGGGFRFGRQWR